MFFRWSLLISLLSISSAKETKPLHLYVWRTQKTIQWKFYEDTSSKMIRLYECSKSWPHRHHNFKIPLLSAILKFKRKNEKKNIADDEKTIHCMLLSFHTRIVLFFLSVKILQIIIQAEHTLRNINITTEIGK